MPAMQIHLIESKSSVGRLLKKFSSYKFQLYMMVLSELRNNYWGAEVAYHLFEQAEAKLRDRPEQHHQTTFTPSNHSTRDNVGSTTTDVPALTAESSVFSISQSRPSETQQAISEEYLFDPETFLLDQFARGSMIDSEGYVEFDSAGTREIRDSRPEHIGSWGCGPNDQSMPSDNANGGNDPTGNFGVNSFLTVDEFQTRCFHLS